MSNDPRDPSFPSASSLSPRSSAPRMRPLPLSTAQDRPTAAPPVEEGDQTLLDPSSRPPIPPPPRFPIPSSRPLPSGRSNPPLPRSPLSSSSFYENVPHHGAYSQEASSRSSFPPFLLFLILLLATLFVYTSFFQADSLTKNPAPPVSVTSVVDGKEIQTSLTGKLTVLNFWATWCPACVHTLSAATQRASELQKQGLQYLLINVDQGADPAQIRSFLEGRGITGSLLQSHVLGLATASRYKVTALPTSVVIGPNGKILHAQPGHIPSTLLQEYIRSHGQKTASLPPPAILPKRPS